MAVGSRRHLANGPDYWFKAHFQTTKMMRMERPLKYLWSGVVVVVKGHCCGCETAVKRPSNGCEMARTNVKWPFYGFVVFLWRFCCRFISLGQQSTKGCQIDYNVVGGGSIECLWCCKWQNCCQFNNPLLSVKEVSRMSPTTFWSLHLIRCLGVTWIMLHFSITEIALHMVPFQYKNVLPVWITMLKKRRPSGRLSFNISILLR